MTNKLLRLFSRDGSQDIDSLFPENEMGSNSQSVINIGRTNIVFAEFTRENNATPYSAGDVISSSAASPVVLTIPGVMRFFGGSGFLSNVRVIFNTKTVIPLLRVHFFSASNPTIAGDNLPHKELYADCSKRLGFIDLPAMTTATDVTNSDMSRASSSLASGIPVRAQPDSKNLYVLLQTLSTLTLPALSKVTVAVSVVND